MPEISVLMPALNAEATIGQAVSSTLRAMPRDAELVLLDDGSTDTTVEQAQRAAQEQGRSTALRILSNPTPNGVAAGLNRLLAETDSRLVARMDADDVSLAGRFRVCMPQLADGDDFVFTQVVNKAQWRLHPHLPVAIESGSLPYALLVTNPLVHPTMLAKRTAIAELGGYRNVPAEDYDLWIRAATAGKRLRRVASWGLLYRLHPGQISGSRQWTNASWRNPDQAEAYAQLAEHLLGEPLPRLVAIAALPQAEKDRQLQRFAALVDPAIRRLPGLYGLMLRRRLAARLTWARTAAPHNT